MELHEREQEHSTPARDHYYGDVVRKLFLAAGVLLLLATVRDREFLPLYLTIGVFASLILTVLAGLTNPLIHNVNTQRVIIADVVISAVFFIIFEYLAIAAYVDARAIDDEVFLIRQALAIVFLVATYFSTKTLRTIFLK